MRSGFIPVSGFCVFLFLTSVADSAVNLVPNGDFELGNADFGSDYQFSASNFAENQYAVLTSPFPWNPNFIVTGDHTTGVGNMFVGNGSPDVTDRVWYRDAIVVDPSTDYFFEAFVMNVVDPAKYAPGADPSTFSILSFYANGTLLGTRTTDQLGVWQGLSTQWHSGLATTVDLMILNSNPIASGNDFAIDDIFLGRQSTVNPVDPVPEPTTLVMWLVGGLVVVRRRQMRNR